MCKHNAWVEEVDGKKVVRLCNDDDGYYMQEFKTEDALNIFIDDLLKARYEAFRADEFKRSYGD